MRTLVLAALVFSSSAVVASPASTAGYEIGARVGGYGFRREAKGADPLWDECRMNGMGIFGARTLTGPLFVEAGLDLYSSIGGQPEDLPLDRTSGLVSAALGVRTQVASWLRGYVQLGTGVELTRLSVRYGDERIRDNKAIPEGFFGVGADLRIARGTHVGASIRMLVMGNFDYDPQRLDMNAGWLAAPDRREVFDASPDVAAQAQFYLRREL
jgi:hypothetical protein